MSTPAHVLIETVTYTSAFGLGLWDAAAGRLISDGIKVRVFPLLGSRALAPRNATPNGSGIFVAHGLPGLREFEAGSGDTEFWASPPQPARPFLVEVRDTLGWYTPFVMHVGLPAPRGLVQPDCVDDLWPSGAVSTTLEPATSTPPYAPLFSTTARGTPGGAAAVRATLIDSDTGLPAESAVLEVRYSRRLLARGIADSRGEVAVFFPYPEPPMPALSSPLGSPAASPPAPPPLARQTWSLRVRVRYQRDLPRYTPDPARSALPDLCEVLRQPRAVVRNAPTGTLCTNATLRYGRDLVLGAYGGAELFIRPA